MIIVIKVFNIYIYIMLKYYRYCFLFYNVFLYYKCFIISFKNKINYNLYFIDLMHFNEFGIVFFKIYNKKSKFVDRLLKYDGDGVLRLLKFLVILKI
jgi:hypothetical protein